MAQSLPETGVVVSGLTVAVTCVTVPEFADNLLLDILTFSLCKQATENGYSWTSA